MPLSAGLHPDFDVDNVLKNLRAAPQRAPAVIWKTLGCSTGSLSESKKLGLGKGERRGQRAFQGTSSFEVERVVLDGEPYRSVETHPVLLMSGRQLQEDLCRGG